MEVFRGKNKNRETFTRKPSVGQIQLGKLDQCQAEGFQCPKCSKIYSEKLQLDFHMRFHTGEFKFWCDKCLKGFIKKEHYENHMIANHKGRLLLCEYCTKSFQSISLLKQHVTGHENVKFWCEKCLKGFIEKEHYDNHMIVNHKSRLLLCEYCAQPFKSMSVLKQHLKEHGGKSDVSQVGQEKIKPNEDGRWQCPSCPKTYSRVSHLERHMPVHTGNFQFWCEICEKGFCQKTPYEDHMKKHVGGIDVCPYQYCRKSFGSTSGLREHIMTHTGKYPFFCGVCGEGMVNRKRLRDHAHVHADQYFCAMHRTRFRVKADLEEHVDKYKSKGVLCIVL